MLKRWLLTTWMAAAALGLAVPAAAAPSPSEPEGGELKAPWKFAPDKHILAPRDPYSFRREKSLLNEASHKPVLHAEDDLARKRLALYGQRVGDGPSGSHAPGPAGREAPPSAPAKSIAEQPTRLAGVLAAVATGLFAVGLVSLLVWKKKHVSKAPVNDKAVARSAMRKIPPAMQRKMAEKKGGLRAKSDPPPGRRSA